MNYYSTNNRNLRTTLQEAVLKGLADDNGLFMPEYIPALPPDFFRGIHEMDFRQIALAVVKAFAADDIEDAELRRIVDHTLQFDVPLVEIEPGISALELFHGPTMAFKDVGARFMSQLLRHFSSQINREIVVLVATSGDTGSAVANGFLGVPGIRVVVLYPSGKVSDVQEKQFTTLGRNITALEVAGTFDDCQRLVKTAFLDETLRERYFLTSANSINIARLIPQSFYYFEAYARRKRRERPVVFSVPSGNFGNLTAGLIAKRMGLPIGRFVASTNVNDVVPEYLRLGQINPRPSVQTISNAMDVGNPSNFARMMDLYGGNVDEIRKDIEGYAFTDEQTTKAMTEVAATRGYVLDPHGAVGYLGLKKYFDEHGDNADGIFLETAHPAKFKDVVESALGREIPLPPALSEFMNGVKDTVMVSREYEGFRKTLQTILK